VKASDADLATLRAQVTSKGGTTERGIATLEEAAVKAVFVRAVKAAAARATELGDAAGGQG
jgi:pyrroline-5-carboxylate reductase